MVLGVVPGLVILRKLLGLGGGAQRLRIAARLRSGIGHVLFGIEVLEAAAPVDPQAFIDVGRAVNSTHPRACEELVRLAQTLLQQQGAGQST